MCGLHDSAVRKAPVDSQRYSTPRPPHGISAGLREWVVLTVWPEITKSSSLTSPMCSALILLL